MPNANSWNQDMASSSSSSTCSSQLTGSIITSQQPAPGPNNTLETIKNERVDKVCVFCKRATVDEVNLGCLYSRDGVTCHYFCLLFCSNLVQGGIEDTDGILCFLTKDIMKEVNRVHQKNKNLNFYKCRYCKEPGATIGCCIKSCNAIYHFPCGLSNGASFRFTSGFSSYCKVHSDTKLPKLILKRRAKINKNCVICTDPFPEEKNVQQNYPVVSQCRRHVTFYHKYCIQNYALSAGCMFKCPVCAEKKMFKADVRMQGIFVPHRDASWEEEPGAFQDFQQVHSTCDAMPCICPMGRGHRRNATNSPWRLLRCSVCASVGTHVGCCNDYLECSTARWVCPDCSEVEAKLKKNRSKQETVVTITISDDSNTSDNDNGNNDQNSVIRLSSDSSSSVTSSVRVCRTGAREPSPCSSIDSSSSSSLFIPVQKGRKRSTRRCFTLQSDSDTKVQDSDDKNETDNEKTQAEVGDQPSKSEAKKTNNESSYEAKKRENHHDSDEIIWCTSGNDDAHDISRGSKALDRSSSEDSLFEKVLRPKKRKRKASSENIRVMSKTSVSPIQKQNRLPSRPSSTTSSLLSI